jgi:hypothetical protein
MQSTIQQTQSNRIKLAQIESALAELLADTLRRGFHGKAVLELSVQDGTVQHIRRVVERIQR